MFTFQAMFLRRHSNHLSISIQQLYTQCQTSACLISRSMKVCQLQEVLEKFFYPSTDTNEKSAFLWLYRPLVKPEQNISRVIILPTSVFFRFSKAQKSERVRPVASHYRGRLRRTRYREPRTLFRVKGITGTT